MSSRHGHFLERRARQLVPKRQKDDTKRMAMQSISSLCSDWLFFVVWKEIWSFVLFVCLFLEPTRCQNCSWGCQTREGTIYPTTNLWWPNIRSFVRLMMEAEYDWFDRNNAFLMFVMAFVQVRVGSDVFDLMLGCHQLFAVIVNTTPNNNPSSWNLVSRWFHISLKFRKRRLIKHIRAKAIDENAPNHHKWWASSWKTEDIVKSVLTLSIQLCQNTAKCSNLHASFCWKKNCSKWTVKQENSFTVSFQLCFALSAKLSNFLFLDECMEKFTNWNSWVNVIQQECVNCPLQVPNIPPKFVGIFVGFQCSWCSKWWHTLRKIKKIFCKSHANLQISKEDFAWVGSKVDDGVRETRDSGWKHGKRILNFPPGVGWTIWREKSNLLDFQNIELYNFVNNPLNGEDAFAQIQIFVRVNGLLVVTCFYPNGSITRGRNEWPSSQTVLSGGRFPCVCYSVLAVLSHSTFACHFDSLLIHFCFHERTNERTHPPTNYLSCFEPFFW